MIWGFQGLKIKMLNYFFKSKFYIKLKSSVYINQVVSKCHSIKTRNLQQLAAQNMRCFYLGRK